MMDRMYDSLVNGFLNAVVENQIEVVREALKVYDVDIMAINGDHDNALILASLYGHYDMVKYLLSKIDEKYQVECVETANQLGITPIIAACASGSYEILKLLLTVYPKESTISLPVTDLGNTCLGIACANGHLKIVAFLVFNGFGIDPVPGSLCPHPLMLAMMNGHEHILKFFYLPNLIRSPTKLEAYPAEYQEKVHEYVSKIKNAEEIPNVDIDKCCTEFHHLNILALAVVLHDRKMFEILLDLGASLDAILPESGNTVRSVAKKYNFELTPTFFSSNETIQSIESNNTNTNTNSINESKRSKSSRKSLMMKMGKLFKNSNQ